MHRIKPAALAALAVFVVAAIGASAAEATEGPYYKIEGTRLLSGASVGISGKTSKEYILKAGTIEIKSKKSKLTGASFLGSTGANAGSSEEVIEFEENAVVGNGAACKVGTITTAAVSNTLAFANTARTGTLLVFFAPVKGTVFASITFTGTCTIASTSVSGTVAAEAFSSTGAAIVVGAEPGPAVTGEVNFPTTTLKSAFIESGGVLSADQKPKLEAFGLAATLVGKTVVTLALEKKYCISTGAVGTKC
jgi:hypothetical protein